MSNKFRYFSLKIPDPTKTSGSDQNIRIRPGHPDPTELSGSAALDLMDCRRMGSRGRETDKKQKSWHKNNDYKNSNKNKSGGV